MLLDHDNENAWLGALSIQASGILAAMHQDEAIELQEETL